MSEALSASEDAMTDELLTSTQAAALIGVDAKTLGRWASLGRVPVLRTVGGHRRFRRSDLEQLAVVDGDIIEAAVRTLERQSHRLTDEHHERLRALNTAGTAAAVG
jgi:excisionase family DNA binding protein